MENIDLLTFRMKIYNDLNIWLSISSRRKVLYKRWDDDLSRFIDLLNYVRPFGCNVIYGVSDIVIISPFKFINLSNSLDHGTSSL